MIDNTFAEQYLKNLRSMGSIPGTDTVRELLFRVNDPQSGLKVIHIAGTNGKGSVGAMIASILHEAGCRVARFTSPCVFDDHEDITISGQMISPEAYLSCFEVICAANEKMKTEIGRSVTEFEFETVLALYYFNQEKPDYVLLECGMGGLLDATNVIDRPVLSVITDISYDHTAFLGSTLYEIATQKAGILKPGCRGVYIETEPESDRAIKEYALKIGAECHSVSERKATDIAYADEALCYFHRELGEITLHLAGTYQVRNSLLAISAIRLILPEISDETIKRGLSKAYWPGRFEKLSDSPALWIDGAHNPGGVNRLIETIKLLYPKKKIHFVLGVFKDKDYTAELGLLAPLSCDFTCIETPDNPRALHAKDLAEMIKKNYDVPVFFFEKIDSALRNVIQRSGTSDVIICCGSLSHLKYIRDYVNQNRRSMP